MRNFPFSLMDSFWKGQWKDFIHRVELDDEVIKLTWGVISPRRTIANVEKITANRPEVKPSKRMVKVELTNTLPNRILHNR